MSSLSICNMSASSTVFPTDIAQFPEWICKFSKKVLAMGALSGREGFPKVSDNLKSIEPRSDRRCVPAGALRRRRVIP